MSSSISYDDLAYIDLIPNWKEFLSLSGQDEVEHYQRHESAGRPLGASSFVENLEKILKKPLFPEIPSSYPLPLFLAGKHL